MIQPTSASEPTSPSEPSAAGEVDACGHFRQKWGRKDHGLYVCRHTILACGPVGTLPLRLAPAAGVFLGEAPVGE